MPNYCSCLVSFDCSYMLFKEICSYVKSDDSIFDFNKIIPMPESLNITEGTITDQAIAYKVTERLTIPVDQTKLSELISNHHSEDWPRKVVSRVTTWAESATDEEKDKLYAMGKQYVFNKENYGHFTWYGWSIANWGTKWNAEEVSLKKKTFRFDTAWSPCSPVIRALVKRFPEAHIIFQYSEPGCGFCGVEEYKDGVLVYQMSADYREIYKDDDDESDADIPRLIDESILPVSDADPDVLFIPTGTEDDWTVGKIYYREQVDEWTSREFMGEVKYIGDEPTEWFY